MKVLLCINNLGIKELRLWLMYMSTQSSLKLR